MPMPSDLETRRLQARLCEVRVEARADALAGNPGTVTGYAAVFDSPTDIAGLFREQVARGAFAASIGRDDVHALYNHDYRLVLGRYSSGTLRMREDARGLLVEIDLPETQTARDLAESMRRGDVDQMSFGFRAVRQSWDKSQDPPLRTLDEVELLDVSVVPRGAYDDTEAAVRSLEAAQAAAVDARRASERAAIEATRRRLRLRHDLAMRAKA